MMKYRCASSRSVRTWACCCFGVENQSSSGASAKYFPRASYELLGPPQESHPCSDARVLFRPSARWNESRHAEGHRPTGRQAGAAAAKVPDGLP
eukprot:5263061-Pyramimonas_sp.AAC.1